MGRKKVDPIRNYFSLNNDTNSQFCNITNCRIEISNNQLSNMRRHIKNTHPEAYKQYQMDLLRNSKTKTKKSAREPITIKTNTKEIKQACVEMIAKGGCTFNMINSRGFKQIIGPIAKALDITINAVTMKSEISATSAAIKSSISNELKNKIFSVKIDEATRLNRSIMGINVQYIIDNTIHIKTLGMIELTERHTAIYLKNVIMEIMPSFDLSLDQIYTITSDNGRNMLKASSLINNELDSSALSHEEETIEEGFPINQPRDVNEIAELIVAENKSQFLVNTIKCAAHTIQLAVNDTLKEANLKSNIATMRNLAIYLRTPTHRNFLKQNKLKQPILNTPTRWNSTYDMLERLLQMKDYCKSYQHEYVELNIPEYLWNFAINFIEVFSPVKKITLYLQQTQLVIGDFFKSWLELKLSIKNLADPLARILIAKIELREKNLIENQIISTAMVLDPRFNCMVSMDNKKKCINHLKKLYNHSKNLERTELPDVRSVISTTSPCSSSSTSSSSTSSSVSMDINQLLNEYISTQTEINRPLNTEQDEAYREIENYCPRRLDVNTNVLDYWMVMQPELPVLSKLAKIVHAVPATQCSVERCFSSLKLLLSDQRSRLSADLINDILIVKCNSNFEYEEEY